MIPSTRELLPGAPAHGRSGWSRVCAGVSGAAVLAGAALVGIALAAGPGLAAPGYVSEAATGALAGAYRVGMLAVAAGVLALGGALVRISLVAAGLLTAAAAAAAVSGAVPCTPGCPLPPYEVASGADLLHGAASIAGLVGVALAMLWLTVLPTTPEPLRRAAAVGASFVVPLGVTEAATMLVVGRGAFAGAVERVLLCCVVAWLAGVAVVRARRDPVAAGPDTGRAS